MYTCINNMHTHVLQCIILWYDIMLHCSISSYIVSYHVSPKVMAVAEVRMAPIAPLAKHDIAVPFTTHVLVSVCNIM